MSHLTEDSDVITSIAAIPWPDKGVTDIWHHSEVTLVNTTVSRVIVVSTSHVTAVGVDKLVIKRSE